MSRFTCFARPGKMWNRLFSRISLDSKMVSLEEYLRRLALVGWFNDISYDVSRCLDLAPHLVAVAGYCAGLLSYEFIPCRYCVGELRSHVYFVHRHFNLQRKLRLYFLWSRVFMFFLYVKIYKKINSNLNCSIL